MPSLSISLSENVIVAETAPAEGAGCLPSGRASELVGVRVLAYSGSR